MALRLWQYLANSSLWIDEAALARNIIDRPAMALLAGLEDAQVAPPAFLLVEKAVVAVAGGSEFALRFFPLSCGLLALVLFARLAKDLLERWAVPFAVGLFALGTPLVYFPSQVKQYSTDTAAALVVLTAAVGFAREPSNKKRGLALAAAGAVAPWFSQPTSFVVAAAAISLTVQYVWQRSNQPLSTVLRVLIPWGISGAAASLIALQTISPTTAILPLDLVRWILAIPTSQRARCAVAAESTDLGLWHLRERASPHKWRVELSVVVPVRHRHVCRVRGAMETSSRRGLVSCLPPLLALGASALNVYPFTGRLVAYWRRRSC